MKTLILIVLLAGTASAIPSASTARGMTESALNAEQTQIITSLVDKVTTGIETAAKAGSYSVSIGYGKTEYVLVYAIVAKLRAHDYTVDINRAGHLLVIQWGK